MSPNNAEGFTTAHLTVICPAVFLILTLLVASLPILQPLSGLLLQVLVYWAIALGACAIPDDVVMVWTFLLLAFLSFCVLQKRNRLAGLFILLAAFVVLAVDFAAGLVGTQALVLRIVVLVLRARGVDAAVEGRAVRFSLGGKGLFVSVFESAFGSGGGWAWRK